MKISEVYQTFKTNQNLSALLLEIQRHIYAGDKSIVHRRRVRSFICQAGRQVLNCTAGACSFYTAVPLWNSGLLIL